MKTINKYIQAICLSTLFIFSSCLNDLDTLPIDPDQPVDFNQKAELAKLYAGLAITGNQAPAGKPDIMDLDEGTSGFLRLIWNMNELTSDEVICSWQNDIDVYPLNFQNYNADNGLVKGLYYRLMYQITICNHFINKTNDDPSAAMVNAEARFLRALSYYYMIDFYGGAPFVDENTPVGEFYMPDYIGRKELYTYVENELLDILPALKEPTKNDRSHYGRANKAAAWMLLSRLYLNAEVYTGTAQYGKAATYAGYVVNSPAYELEGVYKHLFGADNDTSLEIIFSINYDGKQTFTYGGTTFLVLGCLNSDMNTVKDFGVTGGWGGNRARKALVDKFTGADDRYLFFSTDRSKEIEKPNTFAQGYSFTKFSNLQYRRSITTPGDILPGKDMDYVDTDFPFFRLGEAILNYAEALARTGQKPQAVIEVNKLRDRAHASQISLADLADVNAFFADERARELYLEGVRRTDLIRFGLYDNGIWDWKGGVKEGTKISSHLKLYPFPNSELTANPKLKPYQNPGY